MAMSKEFVAVVREAIQMNSSPSIDRSDAHGARGQGAYIVVDNHVRHVAYDIWTALQHEPGLVAPAQEPPPTT